jgi:hypothetical protein
MPGAPPEIWRRTRERAKEEAALEKERERRQQAIDRAQGALDAAHRKHEEQAEEAGWEKERGHACNLRCDRR